LILKIQIAGEIFRHSPTVIRNLPKSYSRLFAGRLPLPVNQHKMTNHSFNTDKVLQLSLWTVLFATVAVVIFTAGKWFVP
jgi:hypothetical protein